MNSEYVFQSNIFKAYLYYGTFQKTQPLQKTTVITVVKN